jgi:hypothetical protein
MDSTLKTISSHIFSQAKSKPCGGKYVALLIINQKYKLLKANIFILCAFQNRTCCVGFVLGAFAVVNDQQRAVISLTTLWDFSMPRTRTSQL